MSEPETKQPNDIHQLLLTIEVNGLLIQHRLQSAVELALSDYVTFDPEGGRPTHDLDKDGAAMIESLAKAYYHFASADAIRLNSLKPPQPTVFMPNKAERANQTGNISSSITPFPFPGNAP